MTPEVRAWLHDLRHRDQPSAILVGQAIGMLLEAGPGPGRSEIRILYIFDPCATRSCSSQEIKQADGMPGTGRRSRSPNSGTRTTSSGKACSERHRVPPLQPRRVPRRVLPPDSAGKAEIAAGMEQLRAEQRAFRLAGMRRLGITQADVATRLGITQGRVSAIEHAKPGATQLRTLAAYVEALSGRLEIIADSGDERLAFTAPGTEAA